MLDTAVAIETPEGIDFDLVPSGPIARIIAYLADLLIRGLAMAGVSFFLSMLGGMGGGLILVIYFFLEWLYPVVFEVTSGATPGKKWMDLKVVHDDGTPVTLSSSLLRNLLRTVDFMPFLYPTGLITMLCNGQFKRLGDIAAGTLVVQITKPQPPATQELPPPMLPPVALTQAEQAAIIQFTLRSDVLSKPRQAELAGVLEPLLQNLPASSSSQEYQAKENGEQEAPGEQKAIGEQKATGEQNVTRIRQIGAYLLGMRATSYAGSSPESRDQAGSSEGTTM